MRSSLVPLPVLLVALVIAGCGSASPDVSNSGSVADDHAAEEIVTKPDFIAQAAAICASLGEDLEGVQGEVEELGDAIEAGSESAMDEAAAKFNEVASIVQLAVVELRKLRPPAGDEVEIGSFLRTMEAEADLIRQVADAAGSHDVSAMFEPGVKSQEAGKAATEIAQSYGFDECSK